MVKNSNLDLGELLMEHHNKKIYSKDGVITKVFDSKKYPASNVFMEAMNQAYAVESGLNAPKVLDVFPVGDDWAISSEEIKGKTLEALIKEDPSHAKKYISELVKVQIKVLSHLSDNLKLPKLKDKLNKYISNSGLDASTRYDLHAKLEKMPNHYKLCHGDITLHNVIIRDDGEVFLLDWAHATRGNSSGDAACTYLSLLLDNNEKLADLYLKEFCKKADIASQYVQQWVSVVSATKLVTTEDEEKKKILLRNIDVVEY